MNPKHKALKTSLSASLKKHYPNAEKSKPSAHMKGLFKQEQEQSMKRIAARKALSANN